MEPRSYENDFTQWEKYIFIFAGHILIQRNITHAIFACLAHNLLVHRNGVINKSDTFIFYPKYVPYFTWDMKMLILRTMSGLLDIYWKPCLELHVVHVWWNNKMVLRVNCQHFALSLQK